MGSISDPVAFFQDGTLCITNVSIRIQLAQSVCSLNWELNQKYLVFRPVGYPLTHHFAPYHCKHLKSQIMKQQFNANGFKFNGKMI